MLLQKLKVTNSRGDTLDLPLKNPTTGFVVKDVQGIGPVKATLVSSSFAGVDGAQYHTSRREPRNVVIKFGLSPDYAAMSVYDLRAQLYNFFMPRTSATLELELFDKFDTNILTQVLNVEIEGRVESLEPDVFAKDPTVDLSVMCYNPDFIDKNALTFNGNTVDDLTETTLTYDGTVETGYVFTLLPDRLVDEFTIYHITPDDQLRTTYFTLPLNADEDLTIDSRVGSKRVTKLVSGVQSSVLYGMSSQSAWPILKPGDNKIRVYATGAAVPFTIDYMLKYGGL